MLGKNDDGCWPVEGNYVPEEWDEDGYTPNRRPDLDDDSENDTSSLFSATIPMHRYLP